MSTARWVAEEYNVRIRISGSDGIEPERTDIGRILLLPSRGSRILDVILKQGESLTTVLDVDRQYFLKTGAYTVTVSRDVLVGERKIEVKGRITIHVP